ncbi:DNA repair protein Rev1 [Drosophila elegans]|uniref:DNA repair protein Rev1 n=1 Tax=Drosophila elegans TaxID=30023 RepID=UPI0007E61FD8|nr:DNA repair protein Rev1 [Drosophila elegans]XP_041564257.1 DNA repair protein Rev1 [Drosophila elegans]
MSRDENNGFSEWGGYFEAKKSKLEEQFAAASDPFRKSDLFKGISIFANGLTNPSADELKRIMMVHGGTFHHYERSHTTFLIGSVLPDVKVRNTNLSKTISAKWVVDCLANNKIMDYKPYLLYTNQKTSQPRLDFGKMTKNGSISESKMVMEHPPKNELGGILKELQQAEKEVSLSEIKITNLATEDSTADESKLKVEEPPKDELVGILKELQQAVTTSPEKQANLSEIKITNLSTTSNTSSVARTAADPNFLSEFYKNSRLHHIATLGAGFKQYVCELRQNQGSKGFPKRETLKSLKKSNQMGSERFVMHIDMDCFFVSVGLRSHPELRGLPIAVTHSKGGSAATDVPVHPQADRKVELELFAKRFEHHLHDNTKADKVRSGFDKKMSLSEIASCSYEARAKGIRNGMFVGQALKLCPELKTIPYDFEGYKEVAFALYNTVAQYTLNIEAVSCDEMFVELTDLINELKVDVMAFVGHLRQEVHAKTGCPCSAGVSGNKLLARMATKGAKPNGQFLLDCKQDILSYMAPMSLDALPGVGSSMSHKLKLAGLNNCGDVQGTSLERLETVLGKKLGQNLFQNCRGIDERPLAFEQARKTVSAEVNFGIRFTNSNDCEKFLRQLSDEVTKRLIDIKRKTRSINLKIMVRAPEAPVETSKYMGHGVCDTINKSALIKHATDDVNVITSQVLNLMKEADLSPLELRGIGIHLTKLEDASEVPKENVIKRMFVKMSEIKKDQPAVKKPLIEVKSVALEHSTTSLNGDKVEKPPADEIKAKTREPRNVMAMLTAAAVQGRKSLNVEVVPPGAELDPDILAQLPEDIRLEVLTHKEQYLRIAESDGNTAAAPRSPPPLMRLNHSTNGSPLNASDLKPSTSRAAVARLQERTIRKEQAPRVRSDEIVAEYIDELPKHMHPAILEYISRPANEVPGLLMEHNYKSLLNEWVSREEVPKPKDVELIHRQISHMIKNDKLNHIYDVMKYFCRIINAKRSSSCCWHVAYKHIEENIQNQILELEGYSLCFTENIRCYKCT